MAPAATANQSPRPGTRRPQISGISSSFQSGFATPLVVAVVLLAVLLGLWFGADWYGHRSAGPSSMTAQLQAGTALPRPKPLAHFVMTDQDGQEMTEVSLRGKWTFTAIGFTTCHDICPVTMATFAALQRQISAVAGGAVPQFLLFSADPGRDTPEKLAQFVRQFHPDFLGATGSDEAMKAMARDLGGLYMRVNDPKSTDGYTMDHSASIYLINPQGQLVAIFSTPHNPALIAQDFMALVHTTGPQT
jgi:protein SCO1/2